MLLKTLYFIPAERNLQLEGKGSEVLTFSMGLPFCLLISQNGGLCSKFKHFVLLEKASKVGIGGNIVDVLDIFFNCVGGLFYHMCCNQCCLLGVVLVTD